MPRTIPMRLLPKEKPPREDLRKLPMVDKAPNAVKQASPGQKTAVETPKVKMKGVR